MAALPITLQTLAGATQVRRVGLNSQRPVVNLPVNSNRYSGLLKPIMALNINGGVSSGIELITKRGKRMSDWHEIELTVRDYELDQYGVVNNGVYSNYCQIAHYALLERIGVTSQASDGGALALTELSMKFISPLKSGDRFLLRVKVSGMTGVRLTFHDAIIKLPDHQLILEANATGVWLDKNLKPARAPPEVRAAINRFIDESGSD